MTREEHIIESLRAFPRFDRKELHDGSTRLEGTVGIANERGEEAASFKIRVDVPPDFPDQSAHPRAWLLDHHLLPQPTADAHVRDSDGYMCVQMEDRNEIHYAKVGLIGFLQQVVVHLDRIRIWVHNCGFPGPQYAHGGQGVLEYEAQLPRLQTPFNAPLVRLPEALRGVGRPGARLPNAKKPCLCGSGEPFSECHRADVMSVRQEVTALGPRPQAPRHRPSRVPEVLRDFLKRRR